MEHTATYGLTQWSKSDRIQMEDFNSDNLKLEQALAGLAGQNCCAKLLDLTLTANTQKWNIDLSGIDLTKYQKLILYPRLSGNTDQWVYLHFNGGSQEYGTVPMMNDVDRQNFGIMEYTLLIQLLNLYLLGQGITSNVSSSAVSVWGSKGPTLDSGVTHLDMLGLWFNSSGYQIQAGSTFQLYGMKR